MLLRSIRSSRSPSISGSRPWRSWPAHQAAAAAWVRVCSSRLLTPSPTASLTLTWQLALSTLSTARMPVGSTSTPVASTPALLAHPTASASARLSLGRSPRPPAPWVCPHHSQRFRSVVCRSVWVLMTSPTPRSSRMTPSMMSTSLRDCSSSSRTRSLTSSSPTTMTWSSISPAWFAFRLTESLIAFPQTRSFRPLRTQRPALATTNRSATSSSTTTAFSVRKMARLSRRSHSPWSERSVQMASHSPVIPVKDPLLAKSRRASA